jgi:hypothetical protein
MSHDDGDETTGANRPEADRAAAYRAAMREKAKARVKAQREAYKASPAFLAAKERARVARRSTYEKAKAMMTERRARTKAADKEAEKTARDAKVAERDAALLEALRPAATLRPKLRLVVNEDTKANK